jgi:ABC-type dipeptide/oligopeptide/nickel transport system permease subunit
MASDARVLEQYVIGEQISRQQRYLRALSSFIRTKPLGSIGGFIVILLILAAIFPSVFSHGTDPNFGSLRDRLQGPSGAHWFGTDELGRDLYTRIVYGARTSVMIGFGVVFLSSTIATLIGVTSGYAGGWIDTAIQRFVDIGIAMPGLIFIILFVTSFKQIPVTHQSVPTTMAIVAAVGLLISAGSSRIMRGAAIASKQNQYVEAARVLGASPLRIVFRHVLPNVVPIIIVSASIQIGGAILIESSLSFLGYGVQPPTASWGRMITDAQRFLVNYPHLAIFPGLAIFFTVYSFNMLGDGLRDALDPRMRGSR